MDSIVVCPPLRLPLLILSLLLASCLGAQRGFNSILNTSSMS